ncbi:hypothetical protein [Mammaliicoccus sp. I-M35]|uniref:hypothetical protein n=1 Tax=Mammaliicoccus sp. I-M35 TaxID=2898694 RepID=UPI001EFBF6AA|nr:hypothetical protein [Mammaliicoccus sp. I-M35]
MKKILIILFSFLLVLGACGQKEESSKGETKSNKASSAKLSLEEQNKIYKKETKKLSESITKFSDDFFEGYESGKNSSNDDEIEEDIINSDVKKEIQTIKSEIDRYTEKTKNLKDIDTSIGDNAAKTYKVMGLFSERVYELEEFKKNNLAKETSYDIASFDALLTTISTLESLSFEYDSLDSDLKNEELGTKGNESVTNLLALPSDFDHMDNSEVLGTFISEFNDNLSSKDIKILSNKEFRKNNSKIMITETPDISKIEYNSLIDDINKNSPEFFHYEHTNKMVSTTEYNNIMDIRNGIVSADDDSSIEEENSDSEEKEVTRDNVMDLVEDYEGESLDTGTYTYKEPEQKSDGSWGFAFYTKNGELAGSYIVDEDGDVTKYDEDGVEE